VAAGPAADAREAAGEHAAADQSVELALDDLGTTGHGAERRR
jgi:hypothetical protein